MKAIILAVTSLLTNTYAQETCDAGSSWNEDRARCVPKFINIDRATCKKAGFYYLPVNLRRGR
jgi:hypothetical protein